MISALLRISFYDCNRTEALSSFISLYYSEEMFLDNRSPEERLGSGGKQLGQQRGGCLLAK